MGRISQSRGFPSPRRLGSRQQRPRRTLAGLICRSSGFEWGYRDRTSLYLLELREGGHELLDSGGGGEGDCDLGIVSVWRDRNDGAVAEDRVLDLISQLVAELGRGGGCRFERRRA